MNVGLNSFDLNSSDYDQRISDELDRLDKLIAERHAALLSADFAKARAWRVLRKTKVTPNHYYGDQ